MESRAIGRGVLLRNRLLPMIAKLCYNQWWWDIRSHLALRRLSRWWCEGACRIGSNSSSELVSIATFCSRFRALVTLTASAILRFCVKFWAQAGSAQFAASCGDRVLTRSTRAKTDVTSNISVHLGKPRKTDLMLSKRNLFISIVQGNVVYCSRIETCENSPRLFTTLRTTWSKPILIGKAQPFFATLFKSTDGLEDLLLGAVRVYCCFRLPLLRSSNLAWLETIFSTPSTPPSPKRLQNVDIHFLLWTLKKSHCEST